MSSSKILSDDSPTILLYPISYEVTVYGLIGATSARTGAPFLTDVAKKALLKASLPVILLVLPFLLVAFTTKRSKFSSAVPKI